MNYYELLGVTANASFAEIRKAYRKLALTSHPDKNQGDANAEERFKSYSEAYQVLSNPELRRNYDENGYQIPNQNQAFTDPETLFSTLFGGGKFTDLVGEISIGKEMKETLEEIDVNENNSSSHDDVAVKNQIKVAKSEVRAMEREKRVDELLYKLIKKLSIHTEATECEEINESFRALSEMEAETLVNESYGWEMLQTIGGVYINKSKAWLNYNDVTWQSGFGISGIMQNFKGQYQLFTDSLSTLNSAIELKKAFDALANADKIGIDEYERKRLEDDAADKGLKALFKGTSLEIQSILREVCDKLLTINENSDITTIRKRAKSLLILGEAFTSVKVQNYDVISQE